MFALERQERSHAEVSVGVNSNGRQRTSSECCFRRSSVKGAGRVMTRKGSKKAMRDSCGWENPETVMHEHGHGTQLDMTDLVYV